MNGDELCRDMVNEMEARREEFRAVRRWLHAHPEVSNREFATAGYIARQLDAAGIAYRSGVAGTGIVARIDGGGGPVVALRADMDALDIREETGLACASRNDGVMHACGHDFHMAAALAAGLLFNRFRHRLPGGIKLIFQPAEENGPIGGAAPMIADRALDDPGVDAIFACHVDPALPAGQVLVHDGVAAAAADSFVLTVTGRGGHAAYPHTAVDPIAMAAHIVLGFDGLVARTVDSAERAVLSIGTLHGGARRSIIPESVTMEGIMRTFAEPTRTALKARASALCESYCRAMGGVGELRWSEGFEAVVNHPAMARLARRGIDRLMGPGSARTDVPAPLAAEDFSRFLLKAPGAFLWVGVAEGEAMNLHSPHLRIADAALDNCLRALLGAALAVFFPDGVTEKA